MFLFFLIGGGKAVILIPKIPKSKPSFFFDVIEFGINHYFDFKMNPMGPRELLSAYYSFISPLFRVVKRVA